LFSVSGALNAAKKAAEAAKAAAQKVAAAAAAAVKAAAQKAVAAAAAKKNAAPAKPAPLPRPAPQFSDNAVNVVHASDHISINARISIGGAPDMFDHYAPLVLAGLMRWEGYYNGMPVFVNLTEDTSGGNYIGIMLERYDEIKGNGSHASGIGYDGTRWSKATPGGIVMVNGNKNLTVPFNDSHFIKTVTHEFGHTLGLGDAYNYSVQPGFGVVWESWSGVSSIMNNQFAVDGAQSVDYGKMLLAQSLDQWQA
jgi:hypothetical protein